MNNNFTSNKYPGESSSDEDDDSSEDEQDCGSKSESGRSTREIQWCRVGHRRRKVVWPPPSNAGPSTSSSQNQSLGISNARMGNPYLGPKMQLFSQTGYHLAVYADGKVRGTNDENDLHTFLEISSAGYPGHVRIKALLTNYFIAMDRRGRLYGEMDPMIEATVFMESFQGSYNAYLSRKYAHLGWYIGIKKNGKIKKGPKTGYGQKAVKFLPRRSRFE